jgi:KDO2-lipid IV(A) lauroyltransferase
MYLLVFYVFGYRKEVVLNNLHLAFPEKSTKELKSIQARVLQAFC